ncbi:hypothetical protein R3P38DRAFT_2466619, partial [Favolaschia claudopus]
HPLWYIRAAMYLVGILHTRHHVTFSACDLILRVFKFVFENAPSDSFRGASTMPKTLITVLSALDMTDKFVVHPICYNCHRMFDPNLGSDGFCSACEIPLFDTVASVANSLPLGDTPVRPVPAAKPIRVSPLQLPSRGLIEFFKRPGMFQAMNAWKTRLVVPGEMRSMQDGEVWKSIKGPDGESFFHGPSAEKEIRVGVTLSLDWCFRFGRKTSNYGPSHSSGV